MRHFLLLKSHEQMAHSSSAGLLSWLPFTKHFGELPLY